MRGQATRYRNTCTSLVSLQDFAYFDYKSIVTNLTYCIRRSVNYSDLGDKLASISQEGDVAIFDVDTGNQRFHTATLAVGNPKLFLSEGNIIVVSDKMVHNMMN